VTPIKKLTLINVAMKNERKTEGVWTSPYIFIETFRKAEKKVRGR